MQHSIHMKKISARFTAGYTLIEMVVVIGIFSLILFASVAAALIFFRTNSGTLTQAYAVENARAGLQHIVADLRGAQYGADGSYPLANISGTDVAFYSDINGDGVPERVHYYLSGATLFRGVETAAGSPPAYGAEATSTIASSTQNIAEDVPLFHFYNAGGAEVTTISQANPVAYMTVYLIVNGQGNGAAGDYVLRSTATLRNASQF